MYSIKDLIGMLEVENEYFGSAYNYTVEWLFNEYVKGHNIEKFLSDWPENAKIVLLSDVNNRHPELDFAFGNSFFRSDIASSSYIISKFENFHYLKNHRIYCDESMNIRKVFLRQNVNNEFKNLCFVLGGIIVPNCVDLEEIEKIFKKNTSNEYKYKFFSYGHSMPDCLKSDRFNLLFDYLIQNKIKIHFNAENYFYYALVDILDSITLFDSKEESLLYKSALFFYLNKTFDKTYELLIKYKYPSIPTGSERDFAGELINLLEESIDSDEAANKTIFILGQKLLQILKSINITKLVLVQNNEPFVLEESLMNVYIQTSSVFMWNGVLFDHEKKIEKELEEIDKNYCETLNCSFEDSQNDIGIQISDAISGFVARLLKYINDNSEKNATAVLNTIRNDEKMYRNIKKFYEIYTYSSEFYKYGICMKMSLFEKETFDFFAQNL